MNYPNLLPEKKKYNSLTSPLIFSFNFPFFLRIIFIRLYISPRIINFSHNFSHFGKKEKNSTP